MRIINALILAIFLISAVAGADPLVRFWRGVRDSSKVTSEKFVTDLGRDFLHYTIDVGKGKGLIAYLPALPPIEKGRYAGELPDEIALIIYSSEKEYLDLRATPAGKEYGDAHWNYFLKEKSGSIVPAKYGPVHPGWTVEFDKAYLLVGDAADMKKGSVTLSVCLRPQGQTDNFYKEKIQDRLRAEEKAAKEKGMKTLIVLVAGTYTLEYREWNSESLAVHYEETATCWSKNLPSVDSAPLTWKYGTGFNIQF